MNRHIRQTLFPILAALIWGTAFSVQSIAAEHLDALSFNCSRSIVATLFLVGLDLVFSKVTPGRKNMFQLVGKDRRALLVGGFCCGIAVFIASNLQQVGIAGTSAGKAGFLTTIYIVFVPLLGLMFQGKRSTPLMWGSVAIAVAGLYFLCVTENFSVAPIDFVLLLCALVYAVHILIIEHFSVKVDGIQLSCFQFLVMAVFSGIGALLFEQPIWENVVACLLPTLYVGIFSSGVAYTLQILSLRGSNPTVVSLLLSLESVFALICGALMLHERMSGRELFGCGLMMVSVLLAQLPAASGETAKTE